MFHNMLSSCLLALLLAGCEPPINPVTPKPPERNPVPLAPPERKSEGGVKVDVPGVKVDVKRKDQRDPDKRKIDVNVDVNP